MTSKQRNKMMRCFCITAGAAMIALGATTTRADNLDNLSQQLIQLRGDVDALSNELVLSREEHKQRMKFNYARQNELKAEQKRLQMHINKSEEKLQQHQEQAKHAGADDEQLKPILFSAIEELEQSVRQGLPFKTQERLAVLAELRQQLSADVISAARASGRLWALIEDELRLRQENGLYSQTIELNHEQQLAQVARIGMMMLFFKTSDERVGYAQASNDGWQFVEVSDPDQHGQINQLFDSFRKQIRSGLFTVPNTLQLQNVGL